MKYYRLTEDMSINNKWYLSPINDASYIEQWNFITKPLFEVRDVLNISVEIKGVITDYTENLIYNIPIVSNKVGVILEQYGVSLSRVNILDFKTIENHSYYAMSADILDCVNDEISEYVKYKKGDHVMPERLGDYKFFNKFVLDKKKIKNKHIFRVKGFLIYLIVSETIKKSLEDESLSGIFFEEVAVD